MTDDLAQLKLDAEADTKGGVRVPKSLLTEIEAAKYFGDNFRAERLVIQLALHVQLHDEKLLRLRLITRLERAEAALLKAFELQRVCLDAMSARPGRFHNREGYTIRVALEEFSSARAALPEENDDAE